MKRFFLLLCVICALYTFNAFNACGLSWANNFGSSVEGEEATVTFTHTADCDSARIEFGYPDTTNFYFTADALPAFSASGMILLSDGVDLDSIGTHVVKVTYFENDGDATADGYVAGIWMHEDPIPDSTLGDVSDLANHKVGVYTDSMKDNLITSYKIYNNAIGENQLATTAVYELWSHNISGYSGAGYAGTYIKNLWDKKPAGNFLSDGVWTDAKAGFLDISVASRSSHSAADVKALWGDTLTQLLVTIDSVITATGFDPDSTLLVFLQYIRNNQADYKSTGFSTFDPTIDVVTRVTYVDSAETVITQPAGGSGSDTTAIKAMHDNRGTSTFDPASDNVAVVDSVTGVSRVDSVRKVYFVDSLDQEMSASVSQSDKEDIAEIVKDTAEAHPEIWTDQTSGAGTDTFNLYVFDADTTAVEGVNITIYNKAHTAVVAPSLITDVNGLTTTFQDADTFHLYLQRLGVIYAQWDTIVVSNLGIDTIWVTAYDPGASPDPDLTCIQGYNKDVGGNKNDRLTIILKPVYSNLIDTATGEFIVHEEHYAYSDTGFFTIYVTPSANLLSKQPGEDIDSVRYDLTVKKGYIKQFEWKNIFVPTSDGCVWLKDILE